MIVLRQKVYAQWGKEALDAMREAKSAGLSGKEAREWVSMHANKSGNMVSLTGVGGKTTYGQKVNMDANKAFNNVTNVQNNIAKQEAQRAANRAANKANSVAVREAAIKARNSGFNKGFGAGQASVGLKQGALNTWNRMGKVGKAGTIAAGLGATYLMGKGLFGGKKDKN